MTPLVVALSGPIVWALHFFAVYGTQTVVEATGGSHPTLRILVALYTLAAAALIGMGLRGINRLRMPGTDMAEFMPRLAQGLGALSGLAILWTFVSAMLAD
jgi:hypothetical protein